MLNKRILVLIFLLLFLPLVGCFPSPAPPITENQAPIITSIPITATTVGETYVYNVEATDPDGDTLTYSLITKPMGMTIDPSTGLIKWTPKTEGNYAVVVKVSDGALDIIHSLTIVVSEPYAPPPVNHAPIIASIPNLATVVGIQYTYTIKATDPDGDSITYSLVSGPTGMTFDAPATINWKPTKGQIGAYDVIVKASDGKKDTTQSFTITVEAVELTGIEVSPDTITLLEGASEPFTVTAYYNDGTTPDITSDCTYVSSDSSIASVVFDGLVMAKAFGQATITVTYTPDGLTFTDALVVTVVLPVHNVDLNTYHNTIQEAIDNAVPNNTIEVAAGTYVGTVEVNKPVILLGANAGVCAGVDSDTRGPESVIDNTVFVIRANYVTIDGFKFNGGAFWWKEYAGIYIVASTFGHTVANNILKGPGKDHSPAYRGILFGYDISDTTVSCNEIYGWKTGIFVNPSAEDAGILIQNNSIRDNFAGIGCDGSGVTILGNNFITNDEGFGCAGKNVVAHKNNFFDNVAGVNSYAGAIIDATVNWWGYISGPFHVTNPSGKGDAVSDNVIFSPWSLVPYPH